MHTPCDSPTKKYLVETSIWIYVDLSVVTIFDGVCLACLGDNRLGNFIPGCVLSYYLKYSIRLL